MLMNGLLVNLNVKGEFVKEIPKTIGPRRTRHEYFRKYAFVIFCGRNEKCVKGNHNHDSKAI